MAKNELEVQDLQLLLQVMDSDCSSRSRFSYRRDLFDQQLDEVLRNSGYDMAPSIPWELPSVPLYYATLVSASSKMSKKGCTSDHHSVILHESEEKRSQALRLVNGRVQTVGFASRAAKAGRNHLKPVFWREVINCFFR